MVVGFYIQRRAQLKGIFPNSKYPLHERSSAPLPLFFSDLPLIYLPPSNLLIQSAPYEKDPGHASVYIMGLFNLYVLTLLNLFAWLISLYLEFTLSMYLQYMYKSILQSSWIYLWYIQSILQSAWIYLWYIQYINNHMSKVWIQ